MKLARALGALSGEDLKERYWGKRPVVLRPNEGNPLAGLVTVEEVEVRLNDGCATATNLAVIEPSGAKVAPSALYHKQLGPSWSPYFLKKRDLLQHLARGSSFVMHNMTHINPRVAELVADIEATFPDFEADVHLYVSPRAGATGYLVHKDEPQHKIYLQVEGETQWTVYRGAHQKRALSREEAATVLSVDFEVRMTPGSVLYLPPGVFHHATNPSGPRLSVSIPISPRVGVLPVDRTHIPLARFFGAKT